MNEKFDELTKGLAHSITRRSALKKFGVGFASVLAACSGLANKAKGDNVKFCRTDADCPTAYYCHAGICHHSRKGGPF
jgi:hypothetical protein